MADNTQAQKEAVKRYQQQSESWTNISKKDRGDHAS